MSDDIILPEDPRAARRMVGWVTRTRQWCGDDADSEAIARSIGSTHVHCEICQQPARKPWEICEACRRQKAIAWYATLPVETPVPDAPYYSRELNEFFSDREAVEEAAEERQCHVDDLRICNCEPVYVPPLQCDWLEDSLAEDQEVPDEVVQAVEELNKKLKGVFLSWQDTSTRPWKLEGEK